MSGETTSDAPLNPYHSPHGEFGAVRSARNRPTSALVFGILNFLYAGFTICGLGFAVIGLAVTPDPHALDPLLEMMPQGSPYRAFLIVSLVLETIAVFVLVAGGVGLLRFKSWGRTLSIIYASYTIISEVVGGVVNYLVLAAPALQKAAGMPSGPEKAALIGGAVGSSAGAIFGLIYPIVLLVFMLRPSFAAAFREARDATAVA